jgi:hypothetical protein
VFEYPEFKPFTGDGGKIPKYGYTRASFPKNIFHSIEAVRQELRAAGSDLTCSGAFIGKTASKFRSSSSGNNHSGFHLLGRALDLGVPSAFGSSNWFPHQPYVATFENGFDLNTVKPYFVLWARAKPNAPGARNITLQGLTRSGSKVSIKETSGWFINLTEIMAKHGWTRLRDQNKVPLSNASNEPSKYEWWHFEYRIDYHDRASTGETVLFGDEIYRIYDSGFNKSWGGIYKREQELSIQGWYDSVKNRKYEISTKDDPFCGTGKYGYFPK